MKYQVNIIRYEGDKPILLKSLNVTDKASSVSWDNKSYPIKTELVSYVDVDKKIGYLFFEHDKIDQLVFLNDKDAKGLVDVPLTELGDVDKKKLETKKSIIPLRLYALTKMALSATELDMHVAQNVIASIFARLKNFGGSANKTTILLVICMLAIGGMAGYMIGSNTSTHEVIRYINATSNIPSV
jgi:hypothetical protein